jgi:hypothetical protein
MHVASSPHDLQTLLRFQNLRSLFPFFMLHRIQTIGALVPPTTAVVYSPRMAAKKTTLNELGEMLAFVVKHMATKDDIARLDKKIDSVESNLAGKINRLDTRLTKFEEHEIDKRLQLEVRVSA